VPTLPIIFGRKEENQRRHVNNFFVINVITNVRDQNAEETRGEHERDV
jgi:hypothetical protein